MSGSTSAGRRSAQVATCRRLSSHDFHLDRVHDYSPPQGDLVHLLAGVTRLIGKSCKGRSFVRFGRQWPHCA